MTSQSQRLSFQSVAPSPPFGRNLKGKLGGSPTWEVWRFRGELGDRELRQPKARSRLPNTYQYQVVLYLPPFSRNSNVKFCPTPPIRPPRLGVRVDLGGRNFTNRNVVPTFVFEFYTDYRHILHRLVAIHYVTGRQTERSEWAAYAIAPAA